MRRFRAPSLLGFILLFLACAPSPAATPRPPNIVLIFADDLGSKDLNCYGTTDLITPNLDRLASQGIRFDRFYSASSVCSPSRAALLTGRNPLRAGLNTNAPNYPGKPGLPSSEITLAELLKDRGYRTALFGKWHLGTDQQSVPNAQGFDQFFGHLSGCIDNYSHFFYWAEPNVHDLYRNLDEVYEDGKHFTDLIVREAKSFIRKHRKDPFFLYLPLNTPHYPLQASAKFRVVARHLPEPRRSYAAVVAMLDDAVGQILSALHAAQLEEDTIVVFLSDHGHSTEARNYFGRGGQDDLRGAKFSFLEGGIRVPCLIRWPKQVPAGAVRPQTVSSLDLFPTLAEWAGAPLPARTYDGHSLAQVINSPTAPSPHKALHWQSGGQWAVREGDWKLIVNGTDTVHTTKLPSPFLVNLVEDPTESNNLASLHPDRVRSLSELHEAWATQNRPTATK